MTLVDSEGMQPFASLSTLFEFLIERDLREWPFLHCYQELYCCPSNEEEHPYTGEDNLCNNNRHTSILCPGSTALEGISHQLFQTGRPGTW